MADCTDKQANSAAQATYGDLDYDVSDSHNAYVSSSNSVQAHSIIAPQSFKDKYKGLVHPKTNVISRFVARPEFIVPDKVFNEVKKAYDSGFKSGGVQSAQKSARSIAKKLSQNVDNFSYLNRQQYNYTKNWLNNLQKESHNSTFITKTMNAVYGNLFRTNIHVAGLNIAELNRLVATHPIAGTKGIIDAITNTGGKFWQIPDEILQSGVFARDYKSFSIKDASIIEPTQNFLETAAYYTAKNLGNGKVDSSTANKLSFTYEFYNRPEMVFNPESKILTGLMRYGIEDLKYVYGTAANVLIAPSGIEKAKAAQVLFNNVALRSVLFGVGSVVPKQFIESFLDEETVTALYDNEYLALADKITGLNISKDMELKAMSVGAVPAIIQQQIEQGTKHLSDAKASFDAGDEKEARKSLLLATKNLSLLIPGMGDKTFRVGIDTYIENDDLQSNDYNFPLEYLKKMSGFEFMPEEETTDLEQ